MLKEYNLLTKLPVMEKFFTIQGEGHFSGKPFYFIRLGGCDVGCHWCDVKESWNADLHPLTSLDNIIDEIKKESYGISIKSNYFNQNLKLAKQFK